MTAMDLVTRYVNAVRPLLPRAQQDDICAELTDALTSRIEEKEEALGRPLTGPEVEQVLKDFGHPVITAARYGQTQALIGPQLYPVYLLGLRWAVPIAAAFTLLGVAVHGLQDPEHLPHWFGRAISALFQNVIWVIGLVTVGFAVIERVQPDVAPLGDWKPSDLPKAAPSRPVQTRVEAAFSLFFTLFAGAWVAGVVLVPDTYPAVWTPEHWLTQLHVAAGEVWYPTLWLLLLASCAVQALVHAVDLFRPGSGLRTVFKLASNTVSIVIAVVAWQGELFHAVDGLGDTAYAEVVRYVDLGFSAAFAITAVVAAIDTVWTVFKLARGRKPALA